MSSLHIYVVYASRSTDEGTFRTNLMAFGNHVDAQNAAEGAERSDDYVRDCIEEFDDIWKEASHPKAYHHLNEWDRERYRGNKLFEYLINLGIPPHLHEPPPWGDTSYSFEALVFNGQPDQREV